LIKDFGYFTNCNLEQFGVLYSYIKTWKYLGYNKKELLKVLQNRIKVLS